MGSRSRTEGSSNVVAMVKRTQSKGLWIISFKDRIKPSDLLYANHKILKLQSIIITLNNLINHMITYQMLSQIISHFLISTSPNTRGSNQFALNVPRVNTGTYGSNSVKIKAIKDWNKATKKIQFHSDLLFQRSKYVRLVKASF